MDENQPVQQPSNMGPQMGGVPSAGDGAVPQPVQNAAPAEGALPPQNTVNQPPQQGGVDGFISGVPSPAPASSGFEGGANLAPSAEPAPAQPQPMVSSPTAASALPVDAPGQVTPESLAVSTKSKKIPVLVGSVAGLVILAFAVFILLK